MGVERGQLEAFEDVFDEVELPQHYTEMVYPWGRRSCELSRGVERTKGPEPWFIKIVPQPQMG